MFIAAGEPGPLAALVLWVGCDLIEAEDTHENHAHKRGGKKESLPAGLKGDVLQERLPAFRPRT
jgi:hypothetical protein